MHLAPADRRRTVPLESLPPYAPFRCVLTGWLGIILAWHRSRVGERLHASCLLLHGRGDDSPAMRRTLRAGLAVEIDAAHDVLLSTRNVTEADAFTRMNEVRTGRVLPGSRLQRELELPEAETEDADARAPEDLPVAA
jgi:hypothetical protein